MCVDALPGTVWFGAWRNVNVVVWLGTASVEAVNLIERANDKRFRVLARQMSTVHVVTPNAGPPEGEARQAFVASNERIGATVLCGGVVIERTGLLGVAMRSAITGIVILAPKQIRIKVFDSIEPCSIWVADQNNRTDAVPVEAARLLEVLRQAKQEAL